MAEQTLQMRVDQHKLLKNLRYTFSNLTTVLSELLQNGRRAGATAIQVKYFPESARLEISDDGCGIRDFQNLLTIGESGWNDTIQETENPFGMGFLAALFAATNIEVSSLGKRVRFMSDKALDQSVVQLHDDTYIQGTRVIMHGVKLPDLENRLRELVKGFPIQVLFNGDPLPRPYAPSVLTMIEMDIGQVQMSLLPNSGIRRGLMLFLQGFPVFQSRDMSDSECTVVHLNPAQFAARMPDRDKLIDEVECVERVKVAVYAVYRKRLRETKATMDPVRFAHTYYDALRDLGGLALLNDIDYLPPQAVFEFTAYPVQGEIWDFMSCPNKGYTRSEVAAGKIKLCDFSDWELDDTNVGQFMFAKHAGYHLIDSELDHEHWVWEYVEGDFDYGEVCILPGKVRARASFNSRYAPGEVVLCDSYTIAVEYYDTVIMIDSEAMYFDGTYFVPGNWTWGGVILQASNFLDEEDEFEDWTYESEAAEFSALLRKMGSSNPKEILSQLLEDVHVGDFSVLDGTEFVLRIHQGQVTLEERHRATAPKAPSRRAPVKKPAASKATTTRKSGKTSS